jgi:cytoskeletal protein RodZ
MPTIGQILRQTREKKKVTCSQAAAATRMKVQHIEAMERDDFTHMAAPMYAKGFLKLYAEYLGLNPIPVLRAYSEIHEPKERVPLLAEEPASRKKKEKTPWLRIAWAKFQPVWVRWRWRIAGAVVALTLVWMALLGVNRWFRQAAQRAAETPPPTRLERAGPMPVVREPPEPYLEASAVAAQKP